MQAGRAKVVWQRWETQGRVDAEVRLQRQFSGRILSCGQSFQLMPSADLMRPTHITKSNLLYSESTDLNINLVCKISSQK